MAERGDKTTLPQVDQALEQLGSAMEEAGVTGFLQIYDPGSSALQGVSFPATESLREHHPIIQLTVLLTHAMALGTDDEQLEYLLQAVRFAVTGAEADNHTVQ